MVKTRIDDYLIIQVQKRPLAKCKNRIFFVWSWRYYLKNPISVKQFRKCRKISLEIFVGNSE
jgi:hypothetical protein